MIHTLRIDGPRYPACGHRELLVTFEPIWGWGMDGGTSDIIRRACPVCPWEKEGAGDA